MQSLVLRHENLRFAFPSDGFGPVPTLLPPELYKLRRHDAAELAETEFSAALQAEANKPFDVEQGPLSRLHLFRRSDQDIVLLQFHHIVADAASIAILLGEVIDAYFALRAGLPLPSGRRPAHRQAKTDAWRFHRRARSRFRRWARVSAPTPAFGSSSR